MASDFTYRGKLVRVVDGDTIEVVLNREFDFGFGITFEANFPAMLRLADVNAPEVHGESKPQGDVSEHAVNQWFYFVETQPWDKGWPLKIATLKRDHFGRYLARVWAPNSHGEESLNEWLVDQGLAVPYDVGTAGV